MAISVNTGSWYRLTGLLALPSDFAIGAWLRLPNGVTTDSGFNFPFSSGPGGNAPNTARFAAWGLSTASPLSFVTAIYDNNGNGVFDYDWTLPGPDGVVDEWHLFVANKVGITVQTWWTPLGQPATQVGSATSIETAVNLQGFYIGRTDELDTGENNWRNELAEFFILNRGLTESEMTQLAAGANVAVVESAPLVNLRFLQASALVTDLSGNGYDATRTGTDAVTVAHPFVVADIAEQLPPATDSISATFLAQSFSGDISELVPAASDSITAQAIAPEYSAVVSELMPGAIDAGVAEFEAQIVSGDINEAVPAATDSAYALNGAVITQPSAERTVFILPALRVAYVVPSEKRVYI